MAVERNIEEASEKNKIYWNELCGSVLARRLGIKDDSEQSLKKFDDWFMKFYPYLQNYIPFSDLKGKRVLEVGLGYGTVGQKIAESGADYCGLDIAAGPVAMMNHRLFQKGLGGSAQQGSIFQAPFEDEEFDCVVAIGCYHHTGDTQRAIDETYRILKPGGKAIIMVYNAYSYRRWVRSFGETFKYFMADYYSANKKQNTGESERAQYDVNAAGEAAPVTDFFSARAIGKMAARWSSVSVRSENVSDELILLLIPRKLKIMTLGKLWGLDIYCTLTK